MHESSFVSEIEVVPLENLGMVIQEIEKRVIGIFEESGYLGWSWASPSSAPALAPPGSGSGSTHN